MTSSYDSYYDSYVRSFNEGLKNFIQKSPEQRNTELVQNIANTTIQTFFQIMNINNSYINIWVAQSVRCPTLGLAQVVISGSWDLALSRAPRSG